MRTGPKTDLSPEYINSRLEDFVSEVELAGSDHDRLVSLVMEFQDRAELNVCFVTLARLYIDLRTRTGLMQLATDLLVTAGDDQVDHRAIARLAHEVNCIVEPI